MPISSSDGKSGVTRSKVKPKSISASSGAVQFLPSNPKRLGLTITNLTTGSVLIDFSFSISEESYAVELRPGDYYECPFIPIDEVYGRWRNPVQIEGKVAIREFVEL